MYADVYKLNYALAVIYEMLRMFPIVSFYLFGAALAHLICLGHSHR